MGKIEHRYCVVEDLDGELHIHKIPGEVRPTTVLLRRNMPAACGQNKVARVWWDVQPKSPDEAVTQARYSHWNEIQAIEKDLARRKALLKTLDDSRETLVKSAQRLKV